MNIDDPRLTAYALDECDHLEADDRKAIEAALAGDPALAREVDELRRLTTGLRAELHAEKGEGLTPVQRAEVLTSASAGGNVIVNARHRWWRSQMIGLSVAACAVIGISAAVYYQAEHVRHLEVDRNRAANSKSVNSAGVPINLGTEFKEIDDLSETPAPELPNLQLQLADRPVSTTSEGMFFDKGISKHSTTGPSAPTPMLQPASPESAATAGGSLAVTGVTSAPPSPSNPAPTTTWAAQSGAIQPVLKPDTASSVDPAKRAPRPVALASSLGLQPAQSAPSGSGGPAAPAKAAPYFRGRGDETTSASSAVRGTERGVEFDARGFGGIPGSMSGRMGETARAKAMNKVEMADSSGLGDGAERVELRRELAEAEKDLKARTEMALAKKPAVEALVAEEPAARSARPEEEVERLGRRVTELRLRIQEQQDGESNTEAYDSIKDNPFLTALANPLSTFSIDVDTASYSNVRRFLNSNQRPPKGAVRIEELVNYFRYDYPQPKDKDPFGATMEVATCPWATEHRLVRVGIKGREIPRNERPAANLVFLVDVSGSMQPENKLPLVKESLRLLTDQLGADDSVSIAVYAGASGCVLEPTHDKEKVRTALSKLESGGSTNGAAGIQLAYDLAQRAFKKGGSNRVILCTDGDFNVGVTDQSQLVSMIETKAKTGIFLSVLGYGYGNLKDSTLEKLADKGNGNYGYVDTIAEGRRLFVDQLAGTLCTIAKDVKIQVEFNPAQVASYRLIGYENRLLAKEDFNDDTKDAGEIGAGHTVTALYEVVPVGQTAPTVRQTDELKYQPIKAKRDLSVTPPESSSELLTVKVRYKQPDADTSTKLEFPLRDSGATWEKSSRDFRWAAAVAGFGMMLRDSPHKGSISWGLVEELTAEGRSEDGNAERAEFVQLLNKARALSR